MTLPQPYYDRDGITIYHADCRDILPLLHPGSADAVITDPPFGIDFDYGDAHDDNPEAYPAFMREWMTLADPVVGDGAWFVWQGMPLADSWHQWFPKGFRLFAACKGFVQFRPQPVQHSWDPVIFWGNVRGEPNVERKDWHVQRLAPFGANRPRIDHPCPRPLEQVRYIVNIATMPGDVVLDPFMGSGTTLRAALDSGRKAIGIEKHEAYCRVAVNRLAQAVLPLDVPA